jgi:gliding motility-associated protein GldM
MMSKTDQKNKDFANLNFAQTPVPAALATLSQKQSEIRRLESEALEALAAKVGAKEIKFDKVLAMVSPDARSVVAGTKYKAQMFIAAYSSGITPRMSINGSSVPVVDGKGQIEFTAQGGGYDKNGSYKGSVTFQAPDGMKTLDINEEYTVLQPSVQIETATLPPLYFKCANRLSTYSPGLGGLYSPTFSGTGADFIPGGGGKVTIVPTSPDVAMNIVNGGNVLDTKKFRVARVPKPQLVIKVNGAVADEKRGASASTCRVISVDAVADESFKRTNPEDAQYRVSDFEINLARGNRRIAGPSTSIGSMASQAQAGDRYVIIIRGVQRRNFRGDVEDVSSGEITRQVFLY